VSRNIVTVEVVIIAAKTRYILRSCFGC